MKQICMMTLMSLVCCVAVACDQSKNSRNSAGQGVPGQTGAPAKVYMIKEITPENLVKIYEALGRKATGKVAVKLSYRGTGWTQLSAAVIDCAFGEEG